MSTLTCSFIALATVLALQYFNIDIVVFDYDPSNPESRYSLLRIGRRRCTTTTTTTTNTNTNSNESLIDSSIQLPPSLTMQLHSANRSVLGVDFSLALPHVRASASPASVGESYIRRGFHLPLTSWLVLTLLASPTSDGAVIDVGAGTGYFSALAATLSNRRQITLFEANPHMCPYLRLTAFANGIRWNLHCAAVAATSAETLELFVPRRRWLLARAFSRDDDVSFQPPADTLLRVPTVAIDDVVSPDARVALLVVDADNAELQVLNGAQRLLARCAVRDVLLLNLKLSGDVFGKLRGVLALVNRCGYRGFTFIERPDTRAPPQRLAPSRTQGDEASKWQRVLKLVQPWTPGAEWPANRTLWLHIPSTDAERAAMPNQLPESAIASL
jgi:FkbM family methyltransferase